jgi:hypothetical protein
LPSAVALAKAGQSRSEPIMTAVYAILVFVIVIFALNKIEFGRFD